MATAPTPDTKPRVDTPVAAPGAPEDGDHLVSYEEEVEITVFRALWRILEEGEDIAEIATTGIQLTLDHIGILHVFVEFLEIANSMWRKGLPRKSSIEVRVYPTDVVFADNELIINIFVLHVFRAPLGVRF